MKNTNRLDLACAGHLSVCLKPGVRLNGVRTERSVARVYGWRARRANWRPEFAVGAADGDLASNGLEATRHIVQRWPDDKRPRIVAMTAKAMQGDGEECLAGMVEDYLTNPIRFDLLTKVLMRMQPGRVT